MSIRFLSLPIDDVPARRIHASRNPVRGDLGEIDNLCRSISKVGLLQSIVIRALQNDFEVVAGGRRLEACKRLRWRTIPCHIVELSDKEAFEVALTENIERKTLEPLEEARAFKKYVDQAGWGGVTELSRSIGKSPAYISKRIQLLSLPPEVYERIFRRRKSTSVAEEILSLEVPDQLEISRILDKSPMSTRQVRKLVTTIKDAKLVELPEQRDQNDSLWSVQDDRQRLILRCVDQTISALRLALCRLDTVLDKLDKEWVQKEILMQYRVSLHSQIDSLIHMRKKIMRKK